MNQDLTQLGLTEVATAIATKKVSSVEVTTACLKRISEWQASRNCFIRIDADAALNQAKKCDSDLAKGVRPGPLHGVPLAHKDMFYRQGRVSTGGSKILKNEIAKYTATVLKRLDSAGAVELGTLNMVEFAGGPTGHNAHYGHCGNAHNAAFISGGSSSGSGSAVGARLAFGALGSDTGGSIRMPAAANGVIGLKPTHGLVSRFGAIPRSWTLDAVGVLGRNAIDCARLLRAVAGSDENDPVTSLRAVPDYEVNINRPLAGVRIGVPDLRALRGVDEEVGRALQESLEVLSRGGAELVPVVLEDMTVLYRTAETIIKSESASIHGPWLEQRREDYTDLMRSRIEVGQLIPATQYINALRLRAGLARRFLDVTMAGIDALHLPVIPYALPTIAETDFDGDSEEMRALLGRQTMFTRPINLLGLPAMSVPCGFCQRGLPIGFQLIGHPYQDGNLLSMAHAFQQLTDHHLRQPVL